MGPRLKSAILRIHQAPLSNGDSPLRVLIVLNSYEEDGPGRLVYGVCRRLARLETIRLETVALSRGGQLATRLRELGIAAEVVASRGRGGWRQLKAWAARTAARADKPDIVHTHLLWPDLAMRLVQRQLGGIPLVSTCHGLHALDEKGFAAGLAYRVLERATRNRCRAWAAVSDFTRGEMLRAGYPAERVHLVRNGVDCVETHPLPDHLRQRIRSLLHLEEDEKLLVSAGTLRALKGHDVLLRAMPAILARHPRTRLFIFGEGPDREALESLASQLGIAAQVKIIGHLSTLLAQVLSAADVVVHPSRIESFGLVVAEAQACGTPVVASRIGGIPECVVDGETGFLVAPDSPEEIAARVGELLADAELCRHMGDKARQHASAKLELEATVQGYLRLWSQMLGKPLPEQQPESDPESTEQAGI